MARRRRAQKRETFPDPKYGDVVTSKFINVMMLRGKRSIAESIVYRSFERISERGKGDPLQVFHTAIANVKPALEVRSRRVGGATYQVPMELRPERADALAYRWIITAARNRSGREMSMQLADELIEASEGRGAAVKKRDDVHKMSEANRAFAHYRW